MSKQINKTLMVAGVSLTALTQAVNAETITVNWYHGKEFMYPVTQAFTAETGIKVVVTNSDDTFDTDVMLVPDYATLHRVEKEGHFANIRTPERDARVPAQWRDDEGLWYSVMVRTRGIAYNPEKVDGASLKSVYDLADPAFKGRVCLLEGTYKANRTFLATLIAEDGEEKALSWAKALKENMVPLFDNDMDNMSRIAKGECDVAYADNYYYHYMLEGKQTTKYKIPQEYIDVITGYAQQVKFAWLEQETRGNPANVTAIAVNAKTEKREAAERFIDFALSDKGQYLMAENLFKYPVVPGVEWPQRLKDVGRVRISDLDINSLNPYYEVADAIYKEAGWN